MVLNSVHWFRKGLRLHDNPALQGALSGADTVRCVYILDPWFAGSSNIRINRWRIIEVNGNKTPLTYKRFQTIIKRLELPKAPVNTVTLDQMEKCTRYIQENHDEKYGIPSLEELGFDTSELGPAVWQGGETEALARLCKHLERKASVANNAMPKLNADSLLSNATGLSPYLRFGCLSCRTFYYTLLQLYRMIKKHSNPPLSLYGQLLWREFFYTAATSNPNFDRMEGNPICIQIPWDTNQQALTKWADGQTGFPWIDAIMKQLRQEGWIHHLARHAVACFLTRGDLWISWEEGMKVFDEMLLDADFSVNAGSWMWLSCSALFQQFCHFYCPVGFGKRTDPNGDYVRRYLSVLQGYPAEYIYEPWNAPIEVQKAAKCIVGIHYPRPMINHVETSRLNIERMKQIYQQLSHNKGLCLLPAAPCCAADHRSSAAKSVEHGNRAGFISPKRVETVGIMGKRDKPEDTEIEDECRQAKIPCLQSPVGDGRNKQKLMLSDLSHHF
uniref:cryptochrome-2-like isoform X3 n=1 Tax=Pristiophorus japonicus TaxID=55135 RepID=UPI00398EE076